MVLLYKNVHIHLKESGRELERRVGKGTELSPLRLGIVERRGERVSTICGPR